jgi:pyruvate/2-oxoglutarate dehydrogenase complex dihydrolipoamide dehydrogenase (E3) component
LLGGVPSVVFTVPPTTAVGLKESQARAQDLKFKVKSENTPNWFTARRLAERVYGYKRWSKTERIRFSARISSVPTLMR